jgi:hypothetical protein
MHIVASPGAHLRVSNALLRDCPTGMVDRTLIIDAFGGSLDSVLRLPQRTAASATRQRKSSATTSIG